MKREFYPQCEILRTYHLVVLVLSVLQGTALICQLRKFFPLHRKSTVMTAGLHGVSSSHLLAVRTGEAQPGEGLCAHPTAGVLQGEDRNLYRCFLSSSSYIRTAGRFGLPGALWEFAENDALLPLTHFCGRL